MFPHDPYDATGRGELTADPARLYTPEEYLAFELDSEIRHEYYEGRIDPMTGASARHNRIVANLIAHFHTQIRGGPCRVYPSHLRLRIRETGLYTYPDVTVVCGPADLGPGDTLVNPTALVEVLSPTTERYDRGRKAEHYRTIESLRVYLLVSQDEPRIEHYARSGERQWVFTEAVGADERVTLESIRCVLSLADVYEDID